MKNFLVRIFIIFLFISCTEINTKVNRNTIGYGLSSDTLDFGYLKYNDTFKTIVFVKNYSSDTVKIMDIESACGCMTTMLADSVIKPYDSLSFNIEYMPLLSNDSGKIIKYITVRTNAEVPFKNLVIKGNVKK